MGIRILIVEDDDLIGDSLVRGLREEGFSVHAQRRRSRLGGFAGRAVGRWWSSIGGCPSKMA